MPPRTLRRFGRDMHDIEDRAGMQFERVRARILHNDTSNDKMSGKNRLFCCKQAHWVPLLAASDRSMYGPNLWRNSRP